MSFNLNPTNHELDCISIWSQYALQSAGQYSLQEVKNVEVETKRRIKNIFYKHLTDLPPKDLCECLILFHGYLQHLI